MSKNPDVLQLIQDAMFAPDKSNISPQNQELIRRIEWGYTIMLDNPTITDKQLRDKLIVEFNINGGTALNTLYYIRSVLGNVRNASKEFFRYKINTILDEAYQAAKAKNYQQALSLQKIAIALQKNNRTESDDDMVLSLIKDAKVKDLSFSVDPSIAGVKVNEHILSEAQKLAKIYSVEDAEIEEEQDINFDIDDDTTDNE